MCPCDPNAININVPSGPVAPAIIPFGIPFAPSPPNFSPSFPAGFPEDLFNIFDVLQFITPSGILKPNLSINYHKDILDGIVKLLDQFFPFLMFYKFFLPVLDLIICVIEVLCAINNPFKLIRAIKRLFRTCLPAFLSLFPIFALIVMLLSLLFLILSLIDYIISQIQRLIDLLLKNINTIAKATANADSTSVLAAAKKIGLVLCAFQNLFVLLAVFKVIIDVIKDILKLFFAIPPCDDGDNGNDEKCCTPDVCPSFIRNNETVIRVTGTLQYYSRVTVDSGLSLPAGFGSFTSTIREESWQFYDSLAPENLAFINITDAIDLPEGTTKIFFPTDAVYNANTPVEQAPYTVDIRLFYNPTHPWGRSDTLGNRFVQVKNCIITNAPSVNLKSYDNSNFLVNNGVLTIVGGLVYEDDGITPLLVNNQQATLQTLLHKPEFSSLTPPPLSNDGYAFTNVEYTFKINHEILLIKSLITLGCIPTVSLDKTFVNTTFGGNAGFKFSFLNDLLNNNGKVFPDIGATQQCLATGLSALQSNVSAQAVANFQTLATVCLEQLRNDTNSAINDLIGLGFDQYKSTFSLTPTIQFTSRPITVSVSLNETNGLPLAAKMSASTASNIAQRISANISFGEISDFTYDGYQLFTANLTSQQAGSGTIKISFDNKTFSTITIPTNLDQDPIITEQVLNYSFIYSPVAVPNAIGDETDGQARRDNLGS